MPTILVADDNSNIQKMVSLVFKERGIRVVAVGNGEAACRKVPEVHPDVVLADVFMPVRNGYEVCEFVKQDPQFAETPVILLVGAFDPLDEKEARRVGADGVLKKPFVPPEPLIAMVSSLLAKNAPPVEEAPAAVEAAPTPPPAPTVLTPPSPEFAPSSAAADYEEADETVPAFGEPVATPVSKGREAEEEDEAEPENEWARRRATMDYEIDSADSADMVEKLAAESTVDEPEILASRKHLPFGGANVPEIASDAPSGPSSVSWPHLMAPEMTPEPLTEEPERVAAETTAAPIAAESQTLSPVGRQLPSEADIAGPTEIAVPSPLPAAMDYQVPDAMPAGSHADANDLTREVASAEWPLPQIPHESEARTVQSHAAPSEESRDTVVSHPSFDLPLALPETTEREMGYETETVPVKLAVAEPPAADGSSRKELDQATIDDVVARVISKLEPQLHQALANGVLRPLVEELLNQQRDKK